MVFIVILICHARCSIVMLQVNIDAKLVFRVHAKNFIVLLFLTVLLKLMIHDYLSLIVFWFESVVWNVVLSDLPRSMMLRPV